MNKPLGFTLGMLLLGIVAFLYASPEIDWSRERVMKSQEITISPDGASTCDNALLVKDGSCNLQVEGVAYVRDPGTLIYTNTDAEDECDTAAAVGEGKCNAKALALPWEYTLVKFVGIGVFAGAIFLLGWAIYFGVQQG